LPSQSNIGDLASLEQFGRSAAQIVIDTDSLPPVERERVAGDRIRHLLQGELVS
jgi:hypothetical protein